MILLRFILILVLAYYLLKLLFRWIIGSATARRGADTGGDRNARERSYSELTDQEIEDADYEEIGTGDS